MDDNIVISVQPTHASKIRDGVIIITLLDEKARRLVIEEAEHENDTCEHKMDRCRNDPGVVSVLVDVQS